MDFVQDNYKKVSTRQKYPGTNITNKSKIPVFEGYLTGWILLEWMEEEAAVVVFWYIEFEEMGNGSDGRSIKKIYLPEA